MNDTPNLALPYILASQAQKHVTHNEAIRALDCLVQLSVLDRDLATPPGSPAEGDRFIVAASPTGAWAGQAGRVAAYQDGAWNFYTPRAGWAAWIADEAITAVYDAGAWANEIEADKVANAQLADMAATTLKGNNSASPANPSDLTVPQVKLMLALLASDISDLGSAATSAASDFDASGAASSAMSAHLAASDPHTQYHTDARGDARYDASGAASSAMSAHVAASDPHTQYHTDARGDARYDASGAASSAMSAHLAASDPHTQYHTDARGDARYMPVAPSTVGINATADTTNRLALKSPASLFDNDGAGHQQKINKASAGDTASQLYQTGYSGRAEIGLSGDDDFHLKVSPDGSTWFEGITIDRTTGRVDFPSTGIGRNRVINPSGQFAQAGLASTADGAYSGFDQWYVLTQSNPVTPSQLTSVENGTPYMMRLTQSNATAQRFGHAQVFEKSFVEDLRGKVISLSARVRMSVAATLRWAVCEWTGTADSPTKDVVNDWTSATFTAGNFFLSSNLTVVGTGSLALPANTLTTVVSHAIGTVSGALNNLVIVFWTDQAQAQNVTLDVAKVQLETGKSATVFEGRRTAEELTLCQRYFIVLGGSSNGNLGWGMPVTTTGCNSCCVNLPTIMRKAPTVSQSNMQMYDGSSHTISSLGSAFYSGSSVAVDVTSTGLTVGRPAALVTATNGTMTFNARI